VRSSEWVSFVYFGALTALAWLRPLPAARRLQISAIGVPMCLAILLLPRYGALVVRDWVAPVAIIFAGYYQSGRFFVSPSAPLERWLAAWDRRLLGDPVARFASWPRPVLAYLEVVYLGCFLLVPAGFAALAATGHAALADRYWTMVIGAELGAFAPLSLIQTRPPWALERTQGPSDRAMRRLALQVVERLTIRANTFPSGHVAGSLAVAFAVIAVLPWAGAVLLAFAISISVACIAGRYHYVVDVLAGAALAVAVWGAVIALQ
jgi:membrane-associated phospholipid phosphatase